MSIHWMSWVWKHGPQDALDRLVLLKLADNANQDGKCWPSLPEIALATCLSESSVRRSVCNLEKGGWLEVFRGVGRGKSSNYTLIEKVSDSNLLKGITQKGFQQKGFCGTEKGVTQQKPPTPPLIEEPSRTAKEELPEWLDKDLWASWVEMRKQVRNAPFTERARKGILGDLAKLHEIGSTDPNQRLEECIKKGWRGVFFDSDKVAPKPKPKWTDPKTGESLFQ